MSSSCETTRTVEQLRATMDQLFREQHATYKDEPCKLIEDVLKTIQEDHKTVFRPIGSTSVGEATKNEDGLVRTRCMVQHRLEQEYYSYSCDARISGEQEVCKVTSLLRDYIDDGEPVNESSSLVLRTRYCYVLVPVPGSTNWFNDEFLDPPVSQPDTKRQCMEDGVGQVNSSNGSRATTRFIGKFVDDACEDLRMNAVVDVYGVLSAVALVNEIGNTESQAQGDTAIDFPSRPSLPSLHVMRYELVTDHPPDRKLIQKQEDIVIVKNVLLPRLGRLLGDSTRELLNANYLLFHLLSSTYARNAGDLPICSLPLNMAGVKTQRDVDCITGALKLLLPRVKNVPLSAAYLSDARLSPRQNHSSGELEQAELQLPDGTQLLITELGHESGAQVNGNVTENLNALALLISEQRVAYDFGVYSIKYDVDLPMLILSPGTSNFFQTPFRIHYSTPSPTSDPLPSLHELFGAADALDMFRTYIQQSRHYLSKVTINEHNSKAIQNSFVEICQRLPPTEDKAQLMQNLLIISRLLAASEGRNEVLQADWEKAFELETARVELMGELYKQPTGTTRNLYANTNHQANKENVTN